ncbi:MAG: hypothetical protein JST91_14645 [Actinobacteria bacterium]|nr:hypothetical protein [Actinomycetota bacterium]
MLIAYLDRLSVSPGQQVPVRVSTDRPWYRSRLTRHWLADGGAAGLPEEVDAVDGVGAGRWPGREQTTACGSRAVVERPPPLPAAFSVALWVRFSRAPRSVATLIGAGCRAERAGYGVRLHPDGRLEFWLGDGAGVVSVVADDPVTPDRWWACVAAHDARSGRTVVSYRGAPAPWDPAPPTLQSTVSEPAGMEPQRSLPLGMAGSLTVQRSWTEQFDGRIAAPMLFAGNGIGDPVGYREHSAPVIAAWDFAAAPESVTVVDRGPHAAHATLLNMPARGLTGPRWDGGEPNRLLAADTYDAIGFHADDIEDAGWSADFELAIPGDLPSGVYACELTDDEGEREEVPLFVTPAAATADVAVVFPTFTYLAYANERYWASPLVDWRDDTGAEPALQPHDALIAAHPEFGKSLYDLHDDGSGPVCYSSARRPILNLRPRQRQYWTGAPRHFVADMYRVAWLRRLGVPHDVLTDDDLHHRGAGLLAGYRVVVLGSHHEYWSAPMRTALERYVAGGGRVLNIGGNQMWWVVGVHPERPYVIEVRKEDLTHTEPRWGVDGAELRLSTTGEQGGTWRGRGRDAASILATTFAAEGWRHAVPYHRAPDLPGDIADALYDGVGDGPIGTDGLALGGAAGDEYDRTDPRYGTPPVTAVVAVSGGHSHHDGLAGGRRAPSSEIAIYENPCGGGVFAAPSMCWATAMPVDDFRNPVARMTTNALRRFLRAAIPQLPRLEDGRDRQDGTT